jgi:hypothetical protein
MTANHGSPQDRLSPPQLAFKIGARVRLSKLGRHRIRRLRDVPATVVGYSRSVSTVNVMFDGNNSVTSLHASYFAADPERE